MTVELKDYPVRGIVGIVEHRLREGTLSISQVVEMIEEQFPEHDVHVVTHKIDRVYHSTRVEKPWVEDEDFIFSVRAADEHRTSRPLCFEPYAGKSYDSRTMIWVLKRGAEVHWHHAY